MNLRRWILDDSERLVSVKSWWPSIGRNAFSGRVEIAWPVMLVDRKGERYTCLPIWDRARLAAPFRARMENRRDEMSGHWCEAARSDGECNWTECPQTRDGEPMATGRTCPLPWWFEHEDYYPGMRPESPAGDGHD